ncbi:acetyltransferase [Paenibacillus baekrokdamisoli]|uniref:Acetyltransferase n=1 Tax=Paenibacillus baekrokdamisoli TaxID=1712516 RepID=A0A3G9J4H8_9BACL|nr:GNAT family N-acetyltransferase [Paenibacillus baekrokdamisoli]MBB3072375.1 ribosomal protein S18 acetylase RimI-like enzyme [Paenibacillus baekrokdamisoli]BBH23245.1 acetyltransferase [Paenibacillus baekrokdamisoli]
MITYRICTNVTMTQIFEAFTLGFSDYLVPLKMDQDTFVARFFGPEGNTLDHSFIALDQDCPIGLILGGIRQFDRLKTMRCGTLCVAPAYRGQGISYKLVEMHKNIALTAQCKQLFLEVIKDNDRAVKFYERHGYQSVYTLKYYTCMVSSIPPVSPTLPYTMEEITFDTLETFRNAFPDCHINWQSDTPYYAASTQEAFLCAYDANHRQVSLIAMSPQGKVNFLWVDPKYRNQGLGSSLLHKAAHKQKVEKVTVCLSNNASLEGFFRKLGFEKQPLEQYEMYVPL